MMHPVRTLRSVLFFLLAAGAVAAGAQQIAPARTWQELKEETQARADRGAYPLSGLDKQEVREALSSIGSLDRDEWAAAFSTIAQRHVSAAAAAESAGQSAKAREEYLAAWRLFSFARWPTPNSPGKQKAYAQALDAFRHSLRYMNPAPQVVRIPFEGKEIVGYLRMPAQSGRVPLVLSISALDSRKEENIERSDLLVERGVAVFALDMPGTGEAPVPVGLDSERMFSRALDVLLARPDIDPARVAVQGVSWSGYWAAKLAVVERQRIKAVVVQGGPAHGYFQPEWQLKALGTREYLFDLPAARQAIYGARNLDEFLAFGPKLSLQRLGLLDQPSVPMLLINGERDTQVPIADLDLLLHHGSPKEAWVNPTGGHLGRSAEWPDQRIHAQVVVPWLLRQLKGPYAGE
jgi:esterase FrsA